MLTFGQQGLLQQPMLRQKRKALKFLREAFRQQMTDEKTPVSKKKVKHQLQSLMSSMRVNQLRNTFYKKLTQNNIFNQPTEFQLLSEQQKNTRRYIKLKGIYMHPRLLSLFFVLEMIFLIITFVVSSWMAFLTDFVESKTHTSSVIVILNLMTLLISLVKVAIMSMSQKIQKGILVSYITDILADYARSLMMFADVFYILIMGSLLIVRQSGVQRIEELSALLFASSIARIAFSSSNLTIFRTTFMTSTRMDQYYKLFHLIAFNLIFAHFIASMLFAIAKLNNTQNWMTAKNIQHEPWYVQYMWGYYWATTIMMTVGFGDFLPVTYKQGFFVAFLQFFSCIVLAYNISQIGGIISSIRSSQNEFITKIALFKRMSTQNQLQLQLQNRIESYLREEKQIKQKFQFSEQQELLETFPQPLKKQYIMSSNGRLFKYLPFFKNLQKTTLLKFSQTLTSKIYYPTELLSRANVLNQQIMILKDGKIGLSYRKIESKLNGVIVEEIQIKQRDFITNQGRTIVKNIPVLLTTQFLTPGKLVNYDMVAVSYSYVFQLSCGDFIRAIKQSDIDTEYYYSITHQHSSTANEWQQLPCESCMSELMRNKKHTFSIRNINKQRQQQQLSNDEQRLYYHTRFECSKLHYFPIRGVVIYKYLTLKGQQQKRQVIFKRREGRINRESCLMLRRRAFKKYERSRMIGERKRIEKEIERTASLQLITRSNKQYSLQSQQQQQHSQTMREKYLSKHNSDNILQIWDQHLDMIQQRQQHLLQSSQHFYQDQQQINHSIYIQSKGKKDYSLQVVKLAYWDLEIDVMTNYFNYFPHYNASKFDNLELALNKTNKNKALCLIGEMFKAKGFNKNNQKVDNQEKQLNSHQKSNNAMQRFLQIFMKTQQQQQNNSGTKQQRFQNNNKQKNSIDQKKEFIFPDYTKDCEKISNYQMIKKQQEQIVIAQKRRYQERYQNLQHYFPKRQRTTEGSSIRENVRFSFQ